MSCYCFRLFKVLYLHAPAEICICKGELFHYLVHSLFATTFLLIGNAFSSINLNKTFPVVNIHVFSSNGAMVFYE